MPECPQMGGKKMKLTTANIKGKRKRWRQKRYLCQITIA